MKTILLIAPDSGFCRGRARGRFKSKIIEYKQGDTFLEGVLVYDDATKTKRPGILVVHQWLGLTDYEKTSGQKCSRKLGYVAFCADIYGKGVRPKDVQEAGVRGDEIQERPRLAPRPSQCRPGGT